MGFDRREKEYIKTIMDTEKNHQTDLTKVNKHFSYAYPSFKLGKLAIRNLQSLINRESNKLKVLDIGAGAGAMSWLFAENGFDVWLCELEPNSLFSGLVYQHENLGFGKRIVCDAKILPFENETFDVVFCKEFAHHIKDVDSLFMEVNRVLKKGGYFVLIEPVLSIYLRLYSLIHPDPHTGHSYCPTKKYFEIIKKKGFSIQKFGLYFYNESGKMPITKNSKKKFNNDIAGGISVSNRLFKYLYATLLGGTLVVFAEKTQCSDIDKSSTYSIEVIPTDHLVLKDDYLQKVESFYTLVKQVNEEF